MALIAAARAAADRVVATIFVNPRQFGAGEDLSRYPRREEADFAMLRGAGTDMVFAPAPAEVYPPGFATSVRVSGLTDVMDGAARPGHFDGVALVVAKLFNQARPDLAFFGEKDWQQLAVIRAMARDLDLMIDLRAVPTVREDDGLALSSRNAYLSAEERRIAPALHRALASVRRQEDCARAAAGLLVEGFARVDYLECRDGVTLAPSDGPGARVFAAARLGTTRLIDNIPLTKGR
jgi:pantoate--beta-alanine ligase